MQNLGNFADKDIPFDDAFLRVLLCFCSNSLPTGHYQLDLSIKGDRLVAQTLISRNNEERSRWERNGHVGDCSQTGGASCFRNATWKPVAGLLFL